MWYVVVYCVSGAIVQRCLRLPMFSHFNRTQTCDGQTQTHRRTHDHGIYRAEHSSRSKNTTSKCHLLWQRPRENRRCSTVHKSSEEIATNRSVKALT